MTYQITINGQTHLVEGRSHSYEEIVALAFADPAIPTPVEDAIMTVTFKGACGSKAGKGGQGSLSPGERVDVAAGTIFNVADTSNA